MRTKLPKITEEEMKELEQIPLTENDKSIPVDCKVINFTQTHLSTWGDYRGYLTMLSKSYKKNKIEIRSFNSHGEIIWSEHKTKKQVLKMINEGKIKLEKKRA